MFVFRNYNIKAGVVSSDNMKNGIISRLFV